MKKFFLKFLSICVRFSHWFDLIIYSLFVYYSYTSCGSYGWLLFVLPILQLWFCLKYEFLVFKSNDICKNKLLNQHIQTFSGMQGGGKSSFACYLSSFKGYVKRIYSNEPLRINGDFVNLLTEDIITLKSRIDDYSLLYVDECSLYFNNILTNMSDTNYKDLVFSQEILTQLVRHFFDGWVFYISTDTSRLPKPIRENTFVLNYMLNQSFKRISFLTAFVFEYLIKIFYGVKYKGGLRCWCFQEFVKIPCDDIANNYNFDLSTQEKGTNLNNFSNLINVYAFNNPFRFEYDDRFMRGIYKELPKNVDIKYTNLLFSHDILLKLGYGIILEFFNNRK